MSRSFPYTDSDVRQHIDAYARRVFPVKGTTWTYEWYYNNGDPTVSISLTVNGGKQSHQVPVTSILGID